MSELKEGEVGERILRWTRAKDVPREFLRYENIFWGDSFSQQGVSKLWVIWGILYSQRVYEI